MGARADQVRRRLCPPAGRFLASQSPYALLAALLTAGLVATCVAAAWPATSPLSAPARRAGPDHGWRSLYIACLIAAFVCYLAGLFLLTRWTLRLRLVAVFAVAIQLIPLGAP